MCSIISSCEKLPEVQSIYLHVQTSNTTAIEFYKKLGFETVELVRNYYRRIEPPDAYKLVRVLLKVKQQRPASAAVSAACSPPVTAVPPPVAGEVLPVTTTMSPSVVATMALTRAALPKPKVGAEHGALGKKNTPT